MRRVWFAALAFLAFASAQAAYEAPELAPAELDAAKQTAKNSGRAVLLVFGANWCKDCRVLESEMQNDALAKPLAQRYVIVKINVGDFDRNMELGVRFGVPVKKGIPTVAVITPDDKVLAATTAGELADARHMSSEGIRDFLLGLPQAK
jgi:protein disulfide-isomerase